MSLCLGPFLCLPRASNKAALIGAAQSMEGVVPILLQLISARCSPDAVPEVPLRAGAGLLVCRGYCGNGRAAAWKARGVWAQWRSFQGARAHRKRTHVARAVPQRQKKKEKDKKNTTKKFSK